MSTTVRFARPTKADAEDILQLIRELAEYEREPDAVKVTVPTLLEQLSAPRPPFECLLAHEGGVCAGFALFFHNYSTWTGTPGIYLEDFYVRPQLRDRGVGVMLMGRLAELAAERGCARIEWSVLNWNEPAISFYNRRGAVPMNDWTTFRLAGEALERARGKNR